MAARSLRGYAGAAVCLLALGPAAVRGDGPYIGAEATLAMLLHNVAGNATVLDERTIRVDHFSYDGGGPAVYFYLGSNNTDLAFQHGVAIGPLLTGTVYSNDTITVSLSEPETLEGYHALSVWCAAVNVNFGSGTFDELAPRFDAVVRTNGSTVLLVSGRTNTVYELRAYTDTTDWTNTVPVTSFSGTSTVSDTNTAPVRFYQAVAPSPNFP